MSETLEEVDEIAKTIPEVAPPGWGHTKADKKKGTKVGGSAHEFDKDLKSGKFNGLPGDKTAKDKKASMFKIMWAAKNKGDKPHYKPGVKDKLKSQYKEEVEESNLPPHLSKFLDKKGNPNKEAQARIDAGRRKREVAARTKDVTPKGYGPKEEVEMDESDIQARHGTHAPKGINPAKLSKDALEVIRKRRAEKAKEKLRHEDVEEEATYSERISSDVPAGNESKARGTSKIRKYRQVTPGQVRDYEKLTAARMFQAYEDTEIDEKMTPQQRRAREGMRTASQDKAGRKHGAMVPARGDYSKTYDRDTQFKKNIGPQGNRKPHEAERCVK